MNCPGNSAPSPGGICPNPSCFVLGPHRSGTTIVCNALAESRAFVCLTAADIVAFHQRTGAQDAVPHDRDPRSTLAALARRGETRRIDAVRVTEDLPEEYGFLVPGRRLTPETASVVTAVYEDLARGAAREARYLLRNPWDLSRAPRILELFPEASFVFVVRDPVETIDSQLQAARTLYAEPSEYHALLDLRYRRMLGRPRLFALYRFLTGRPRMVDALTHSFARSTTRWIESLDRLPPERWVVARYEDLVAEPRKELGRLYAFLGLSPERIPALAGEIRPGSRTLHPHVAAREAKIRSRTRLYRDWFGY
ncbi:MAG TPA: sulfotransferase [Gemmatimonadota bacterium]|nr:sulfotransferase [Gemmatimonadota bacterium]